MKEEKFEFLFVDMEWNQKVGTQDVANREPIQIGLIGTDDNLDNIKLFSKSMRLDDVGTLTEETCKMAHTNPTSIMQASTVAEVFKRVKMSFPNYKYVVVWTLSTYDLFQQSMERVGIKIPRHRVVVLQDILNLITMAKGQNIGFETALIRAEVPYEKSYLHYSKHDVRYMYELFKKIYGDYQKLTETDISVVNKKSRILHSSGCRYVKHCSSNASVGEKALIFKGYRPCSCCTSEEDWRKIFWEPISRTKVIKRNKNRKIDLRKLPLTDDNIQFICSQFNMKCNVSEGIVFLTTNCGYWRVYLNGDTVDEIFHSNQRIKKQEFKKKKKCNEGFHKQNISMTNFYDVVRYIHYHDKDTYVKRKKSRVEVLLEQIEKERKMKEASSYD